MRINHEAWEHGDYVAAYAHRQLLPVEVVLLARYREVLSGRVLELGCGAGRVLGYLLALGGDIYGVDINRAMVEHCHAAYPEAKVEVGDIAALNLDPAAGFDALLGMDNVFDVFDDEERRTVLADLRSRLVPGGLLIFSSHNLDYVEAPGRAPRGRELVQKALSRPLSDVLGVAVRMPRRVANHRRLAPMERRGDDYALRNDEAHDYQLLHYYIGHDAQARQLESLGYELLECLDVDGSAVKPGQLSSSPWLHYVARRMT